MSATIKEKKQCVSILWKGWSRMKTVCMFFAARRYWADEEKLRSAYETLAAQMGEGIECCLAADAMEEDKLPQGDCLIAVPMSGAVQQNILAAAAAYESVVLYGAYIRGNAPGALCSEMLRCNADGYVGRAAAHDARHTACAE